MIFGKSRYELKVGIFVFFGLVILFVFILLIGDFKTWTAGYKINFIFNFINGVKIGAPIRFAGMDVGEVKEISLFYSNEENKIKVKITGWIKKEAQIPSDSTVWVNTLGLLGEKYLEIIPGKDYAHVLSENQTLVGTDPVAMHEVANMAKNLVDDLDETITRLKNKEGTLGKLLYDDSLYQELEALIKDIRKNPWKLFIKQKEKP